MDVGATAITLLVLAGVLGALFFSSAGADAVLVVGLGSLIVLGVLDPRTALAGFGNEGLMTVAALFVVSAGLRQTGAMNRVAGVLLGQTPGVRSALVRMTFPVAVASAFLNNTPIVAALLPAVREWARRHKLPPSKLLIPLSYATILGGTVTVIGTSTNLVVTGLIQKAIPDNPGLVRVGIFDIAGIGLPLALLGCVALVVLAPILLPDRRPAVSRDDDPRMYTSEFLVQPGSPLIGKSIEEAGLRNLPGSYLAELDRANTALPGVEPTMRLRADDRLVFVGPVESVLDLKRLPGLVPAPDQIFKVDAEEPDRCLVEAVVAPTNPLRGRSIKDGGFRTTFNAVVVAVARDGERVPGRIGDIVLERGDVLLLEAHPSWVESQRGRKDFYLATEVEDSSSFRHDRAWVALIILALMVTAAATEITSMFVAALVACAALLVTGCATASEARRAIDWPVLTSIGAAFGIGEAIRVSGTDQALAERLVSLGAGSPLMALVTMYIATALLTELITNNAAAALMFPFGLSLATQLHVSPMPFCIAVMFAASASFATPIGYQTNLMVYGPGGYRFSDFLRMGVPIQLLAAILSCALIPVFFPF